MKQLFINNECTTVFFSANASSEDIELWINLNLDFFNLNEQHTAGAEVVSNNEFLITGDEDRLELTLEPVVLTIP